MAVKTPTLDMTNRPLLTALGQTKNVVVILVAAFAAYGLFQYWAAGLAEERVAADEQLEGAERELAGLNDRIAAIERGDSDSIVGLFQRGQVADRLIPDNLRSNDYELALPALVDQFGLLNESGISRQSPQTEGQSLEFVPLGLQVTGPLESLIGFTAAAEEADRLVTADLTSVSRNGGIDGDDIWAGSIRIRLWGAPTLPTMPTSANADEVAADTDSADEVAAPTEVDE